MDSELPLSLPSYARIVLLAPDVVARTLAAVDGDPLRRWILRSPRAVRRSFVDEVVAAGGQREDQERWMLLQDDAVRGSYVESVLLAAEDPDREAIWLLSQGLEVRESYVAEVLDELP
jgi:hypothetical protein